MSLLKNCRSFLSNFFFIPVGMLQRNSNMTRLWMFPLSSLSEAEKVLGEISNYKVQIYTNSADAKIPAVLEYLGTVIEAGCKFLIFAHDQPMINAIHECLLVHPVCIKATIGYRFPGKGSYISRRLCYPLKLGSWINFNCCKHSYLCFVEQSWTPGDLIQVENRAHRIDQTLLLWTVTCKKSRSMGGAPLSSCNAVKSTDNVKTEMQSVSESDK
ncbi:hypothetical protein AHAS_Ahas02G0063300 [Arachis hypogaea]